MNRQNGFSLIELLMAVAIILIIAGLAIPSLLRSRMAANEAVAASSLKTIGTANVLYASLYGVGYAGSLAQLGPPSGACATVSAACADLLDGVITGVDAGTPTPVKSGYRLTYYAANPTPTSSAPNSTYAVVATPVGPGAGVSSFCFDFSNIIWKDNSGALTTADPTGCNWPLGGNVGPA